MASLKDKTLSGIFWSFLQNIGARGISFLVMIILARLLTPKDFGLIGMLMIFIQLSQALISGGFNLALIQKKDTDEEDYSSVFYINLIVSCCLYGVLFIVAPFIADFYHQPLLTSLTRVLAIVFVINAFSYVQEARLTREIRFKTLMLIHIPSTIFGGVVSILMAIMGFGVWSIVAMQLVSRFAYSVQIWIYSRWKPKSYFSGKKAKKLFSFGSKLMISGIITTLYQNIYLIILGRFFPVASVGYYQNANSLVNTSSGTITNVLNGVTFPVFSSIQDDDARLKNSYKKAMQQAFFWICPLFVLAGVLAEPLFQFIFTAKWLPAVPYFQWLCIVGVFYPLNIYNLNIVNVKGRSDMWLKLQIVRRVITVIAIVAVFSYGIIALLIVQAASEVFTFLLFSHYAGKFIGFQMMEQIAAILPTLLLSISLGLMVFLIERYLTSLSDIVRLIIGFGIGGGGLWLLAHYFKMAPYIEFIHIFQERIVSRILVKN